MKLKRNTKINIVIPADATPREIFAAEELSKYLTSILDAQTKIVSDNEELKKLKNTLQ